MLLISVIVLLNLCQENHRFFETLCLHAGQRYDNFYLPWYIFLNFFVKNVVFCLFPAKYHPQYTDRSSVAGRILRPTIAGRFYRCFVPTGESVCQFSLFPVLYGKLWHSFKVFYV